MSKRNEMAAQLDAIGGIIRTLDDKIERLSQREASNRDKLAERLARLEWAGEDRVVETPGGLVTLPASEHPCNTPDGPFPHGSVFECDVCGDRWGYRPRFGFDFKTIVGWFRLDAPVDTTTEPQ